MDRTAIKDASELAHYIDAVRFDPDTDPVARFVYRYHVKQSTTCACCGRADHYAGFASILESGTKVVIGHCCTVTLTNYTTLYCSYLDGLFFPFWNERLSPFPFPETHRILPPLVAALVAAQAVSPTHDVDAPSSKTDVLYAVRAHHPYDDHPESPDRGPLPYVTVAAVSSSSANIAPIEPPPRL